MTGSNICDFALCERYFGITADLYESAAKLLAWLHEDQVGRESLSGIAELVLRGKNVSAAAALVERLRSHVAVFYPVRPEGSDVTLAAVMVDLLPSSVASMRSAGVPDDIVRATLRDFAIWADVHREKTGRPGISETEWNLLSLTGNILRIGRLQYESTVLLEPYYVYRDTRDGGLVILAGDGVHVSVAGLPLAAGDDSRAFVTRLRFDDGVITGNPIDTERGVIRRETASLRTDDHDLLLAPGMPATNIHIPADGPLTPELVDYSIAQAKPLLAKLGRLTPVGVCESWLLDPALDQIARTDSNICRFMHRFAKFPNTAPGSALVERVCGWGANALPPEKLPERTGLQRGLKRYLLAGGTVRDVGGILVW
ncbi:MULTISPECIES: acyltransferase domain-containing protein [unclassified Bifidobacterium]|uniref:acyltransferase domain-containing protein n=1 Tax=unclassified Bifidobacterium TaxID=2608897 RepID=UPI0011292023|nr:MULTISPECIES: acyltransferase domain-containing protein [unclassified Bifidobacterium]